MKRRPQQEQRARQRWGRHSEAVRAQAAEYWFEIWQRGIVVAEGSGALLDDVGREMVRYAAQYVQDGPITIKGSPELRPVDAAKR